MPGMRGDCQREFREAAVEDGIDLSRQSLPWLCERGHTALPDAASSAREALAAIFVALGGDLRCLAAGRRNRLPGDFIHTPTRALIEIDEPQHFTSARLTTLDMYPKGVYLGFDLEGYRSLCREWRTGPEGDGYRRTKQARCFGVGGRQRLRAYYDALRDLAAPAMGYPPVVRVPCPDRDGRAGYQRHRERLLTLLTS
jgi:hypothetical protein